ncbi:hypothetical protein D3C72_2270770 [compost metagenome]
MGIERGLAPAGEGLAFPVIAAWLAQAGEPRQCFLLGVGLNLRGGHRAHAEMCSLKGVCAQQLRGIWCEDAKYIENHLQVRSNRGIKR